MIVCVASALSSLSVLAARTPPSRAAVVPVIASLAPNALVAGTSGSNVTVIGSQFDASAQVRWNGAQRPTTFVSATRLVAVISAQDVAATGTAQITVVNPNAGGGTSNAVALPIVNPVPAIVSLSPTTAPLMGEDFGLIINGTGFAQGAVARVNGAARLTTYSGRTRLVARVLSSDLAAPGAAAITIVNPAPGGGASAAESLPIALLRPTVNVVTPAMRQVGLGAFTLRVRGSNFIRSSAVRWNGATRPTTWINDNELDAAILAGDVDAVGTATVTVTVTAPNVGTQVSGPSAFTVANPAPVLGSAPPTPLPIVRFQPVQVSFFGSNFLQGIRLTVNGAPRPTTWVSGGQVRVTLDSVDVDDIGRQEVVFTNPPPSIGTANGGLYIQNPPPAATSLSPQNVFVGSQAFTLTVTGTRFVPGSVVQANGSPRPTTFVSQTQLRAAIPASDLTQIGDLPIRVVTPAPGGGTSSPLNLTRLAQQIIVK
jgi:hypothetical protein